MHPLEQLALVAHSARSSVDMDAPGSHAVPVLLVGFGVSIAPDAALVAAQNTAPLPSGSQKISKMAKMAAAGVKPTTVKASGVAAAGKASGVAKSVNGRAKATAKANCGSSELKMTPANVGSRAYHSAVSQARREGLSVGDQKCRGRAAAHAAKAALRSGV